MRLAKEGRTQTCGVTEARVRAAQARKFLETAELILMLTTTSRLRESPRRSRCLRESLPRMRCVAAAWGAEARGQDHREAIGLLAQVEPNGKALSRALARLLDIKDGSQYGLVFLGTARAKTAVKSAVALTEAAEEVLRA